MRKAVPITGQEEGEAVFSCPAAPLSRRACPPKSTVKDLKNSCLCIEILHFVQDDIAF